MGDKKMMKQLNIEDMEDDDEEIDKGVWGASPIVDVQLSTSDLEEARLQKDGYERVLTAGDGELFLVGRLCVLPPPSLRSPANFAH